MRYDLWSTDPRGQTWRKATTVLYRWCVYAAWGQRYDEPVTRDTADWRPWSYSKDQSRAEAEARRLERGGYLAVVRPVWR